MKKLITLFLLLFVIGTTLTQAQRRQRLSQEERVDRMTTHLYVALELDDTQMKSVKSSINAHITGVKKLILENEQRPEREEFKKLADERDKAIKGVLNEQQAEKYDRMKERLQQRSRMSRRGFSQRGRRGGPNFRRGFRGPIDGEHPRHKRGQKEENKEENGGGDDQ